MLKYKAGAALDLRLVRAVRTVLCATHHDLPLGGREQAGYGGKEGGFTDAGWAHNRHEGTARQVGREPAHQPALATADAEPAQLNVRRAAWGAGEWGRSGPHCLSA